MDGRSHGLDLAGRLVRAQCGEWWSGRCAAERPIRSCTV